MEESKSPDDYYPSLVNNEVKQSIYMISKRVPNADITALSFNSAIVRNKKKIALIQCSDYLPKVTFVNNGKKEDFTEFNTYSSLSDKVCSTLFI